MELSKSTDPRDGSSCELTYDEQEQWIRATWIGFVTPDEAHSGANRFLDAMSALHCPYLLNDNSCLRGPWFDAFDWLRRVWAPQVVAMGLRYIAHVAQPHDLAHAAQVLDAQSFGGQVEVQLFDNVCQAEMWLRDQQKVQVA